MESLEDQKKREAAELVELGIKRYKYAKEFWKPWRVKWVRYYKIWRNLADAVDELEDADEPNSFVPYAFGMIQDLTAVATESVFRLKPPCKVLQKDPQDEKPAEKFSAMASSYFSTHDYRMDFIGGCTERMITGNQWEEYVWANDWRKGFRWAKVEIPRAIEAVVEVLGAKVQDLVHKMIPEFKMVEDKHPVRVGFQTIQCSAFHIHPEPHIKSLRDVSWLVKEEPSVRVEDLKAKMFKDPISGVEVPVFDLDEMIEQEKSGDPKKIINPTDIAGDDSSYRECLEIMSGTADDGSRHKDDGIDRVHLIHIYTNDGKVFTIAQGKYLIRTPKASPVACLPFGLRVYTVDPQFLLGSGAIEPIEDQVYNINDIGNLAMSNWLRIINGLLAVDKDKLVDEDDLEPRPSRVVRIQDGNVHEAVATFTQQDVAGSMMAMDSMQKGIIERANGVADFAPGVGGQKQEHDTATGVMEIQANMAKRRAMNMRIDLACYQRQMWLMEKIISFHQFEPLSFVVRNPDGGASVAYMSLDDIYTNGRGFEYVVEDDPSFGDDNVQRNLRLRFLEVLMNYDEWRQKFGTPDDPGGNIPEVVRGIARNFGYEDSGSVLRKMDNTMEPEAELAMLMSGGEISVNPKEHLTKHLLTHMAQRQNPELISGKVPPEFVEKLDAHIQETHAMLTVIMRDPYGVMRDMNQGAMQGVAMMGGQNGPR
jgi:hypothetical protein